MKLLLIISALMLGFEAYASSQRLTGKLSNYSAYFLNDEKLRHHRYELSVRQDTDYGPAFKTVIAGRLWWDPVLMDNDFAARRSYPQEVREDELYQGEMREAYVDYLGDWYRFRIGRQIVDWTDTFAPALVNMVTAVDVRHGVSGDPVDYIVPIDAARISHSFLGNGTLEWLVVPRGVHHRFPKGDNGYGYYRFIQKGIEPRKLVLKEDEISRDQDHIEAGVKYQTSLGSVDYHLFAYRGHQRDPAFRLEGGLSSVVLTQYYPRVDTYGTTLTWAGEAMVIRGLGFYEPKRKPRDKEIFTYEEGTIGDDVYDRRIQLGLGLDYVFSRHLKVYSNHYYVRLDTIIPKDSTREERNIEGFEDSYVGVVRLTNQSFDNLEFKVDAAFTSPNQARMIEPSIVYQWDQGYTLALGWRQVVAKHDMSVLAPYEDSDLVFIRLSSLVNVGDYFANQ